MPNLHTSHGRESEVPGVSRHKGRWRARVHYHNEWLHVGLYEAKEEAEHAALDALFVLNPQRAERLIEKIGQKGHCVHPPRKPFNSIGGRIFLFRKTKHLSRRKAANLAGLSRWTWRRLEEDKCQCLAVTLVRVADVLGLSLDRLWGRESPEGEQVA